MPLVGTRDVTPLLAGTALMPDFETEQWELKGVQVLQVLYELRQESMLTLLPPALHPTIPPTLFFTVTIVPDSSVGPFTLAEVRVGCRAAARPRAFLARAYCDSEAASNELRARWGYPISVADVQFRRNYDRVTGIVKVDGATVLDVGLSNPEPISGGDVQYLPSMNLARANRDGQEIVRLVQVDPDWVFHKADRGKPVLTAFDAGAWLVDGADPWYPVSASAVTVDMVMPRIRYLMDPAKPPMQGIETIRR
ncbi:hypothetical protein AYO38_04760 [bacterium SCGC AG-212-C10]|nr:hypothetical protein AYO38_04760 [bacterium SCGC AG-212-C10]